MSDAVPDFTPVSLLTGFLGSGKTTLLQRVLADPAFADTAVVINEFGEIGLDHLLVESVTDDVVVLPSGCLCCALQGELATTLRDLQSRRTRGRVQPFRRVIVESTGLADPYPVVSTLKADPVLRHHFRLGAVVTTVDAVNGAETLDRHVESIRQAAIADTLILTKTDLADAARVDGLSARLRALNPTAAIRRASDEDLALDRTIDGIDSANGWFKATAEPVEASASEVRPHRSDIRSISLTIDTPVDWTAFGIWLSMLINRHGSRVLRVKGILSLIDEPNPVAIHGVQHLVHPPRHMRGWPDADHRSRLVFIVDGIDPQLLRRSLMASLSLGAGVRA
ncbi:MAG: GTP-binding protein [Ancalomicrobiaceae bacterium]|nr:GTP-binding protein [Ancalomicrobiaceae bacterium]